MPVFLVFAACAFASGFALRLVDPLVLPLAQAFAVAPATAAALTTAYALPYALAQPFLGPLGDRFGKPRCMQVCVTGLAVALAAGAAAPTFALLLASRAVAGVFAGGLVPLVLASLGDRYALVVERQVMIGRMLFAIIGGQTLGSAISGWVGDAAGWRASLAVAAGVTALACAVAWRGMPVASVSVSGLAPASAAGAAGATGAAASAAPGKASPPSMRSLYAQVFANPKTVWVYGCVGVEATLFFAVFPFVGTLIAQQAGGDADAASSIAATGEVARHAGLAIGAFGLGGLVYALAVRQLIARLGVARMCVAGSLLAAVAYAALPFAPAWGWHALALGVAGLAFNMIHNSLQTEATELAPAARGSAVALFACGLFAGQGLGPLLLGPLAQAVGFGPALAGVGLGIAVLGQVVVRRLLR